MWRDSLKKSCVSEKVDVVTVGCVDLIQLRLREKFAVCVDFAWTRLVYCFGTTTLDILLTNVIYLFADEHAFDAWNAEQKLEKPSKSFLRCFKQWLVCDKIGLDRQIRLEPIVMKVTPYCCFLNDEVFPDFWLECKVMNVLRYAFVVWACVDHVKQWVHGVKRITNDHDAFVSVELNATDPLRKMCLYNPNPIAVLTFTLHTHVFQLLIHRTA